jgi:hypothetical protein
MACLSPPSQALTKRVGRTLHRVGGHCQRAHVWLTRPRDDAAQAKLASRLRRAQVSTQATSRAHAVAPLHRQAVAEHPMWSPPTHRRLASCPRGHGPRFGLAWTPPRTPPEPPVHPSPEPGRCAVLRPTPRASAPTSVPPWQRCHHRFSDARPLSRARPRRERITATPGRASRASGCPNPRKRSGPTNLKLIASGRKLAALVADGFASRLNSPNGVSIDIRGTGVAT